MENHSRLLLLTASLVALLATSGCSVFRRREGAREAADRATGCRRGSGGRRRCHAAARSSSRTWRAAGSRRPRSTTRTGSWAVATDSCPSTTSARTPPWPRRSRYHVTEDFFFRGDLGQSTAGQTRASRRSAATSNCLPEIRGASRITASRWATTSSLARSFSVARLAMNSGFYTLVWHRQREVRRVTTISTLNFGAGFRVLPTDWLAIHLGVQDRVFDSDLLRRGPRSPTTSRCCSSATVFF